MALVTWTDGQTLDAADLNGNFAALAASIPTPLSRAGFAGYIVETATPAQVSVTDAGPTSPLYFSSPWSTSGIGVSFVGVPVPAANSWTAKAVIRPVSYWPQYAMIGLALWDATTGKNCIYSVRRRLYGGYENDVLEFANWSDPFSFVSSGNTCLSALPDTSLFGLGFAFAQGAGLSAFSYSGDGRLYTPIGALSASPNTDYVANPTHVGISVIGGTGAINIANPGDDATPIVVALEGWSLG
jgi:hypothetical protein